MSEEREKVSQFKDIFDRHGLPHEGSSSIKSSQTWGVNLVRLARRLPFLAPALLGAYLGMVKVVEAQQPKLKVHHLGYADFWPDLIWSLT